MVSLKSNWTESFSYHESIEILTDLALSHAAEAGPFSEVISDFIRNRSWGELLDWQLDYIDGLNSVHLVNARQALAFFQKFEPLEYPAEMSKTKAAFWAFCQSEELCGLVNQRFRNYRMGFPMGYPYDVIFNDARSRIRQILGTAPKLQDLHFSFGPGAQTNVKKSVASPRVKLGEPLECSNELEPFLSTFLREIPAYLLHHADACFETPQGLEVTYLYSVQSGRLQFVPKDAKKYRTIVVEPGLNVLFQQGLGRAIRKRLKKAGVNLDDQGRNRELARRGSLADHLATIDFSSASDTISKGLLTF